MSFDWSQVDTLLLDMDGTLLDLHFDNHFWMDFLPTIYAEHYQMDLRDTRQHLQQLMKDAEGTMDWYCVDYWTNKLGLDIVSLKKEVDHLIALRPAVSDFLQNLHASKIKVHLITNAHHDVLELKLEKTKISHYFDELISSHAYGFIKEQQEFWHLLSANIEFDARRTLFIDDSEAVLDSAVEYGIGHVLSVAKPDSQQQRTKQSKYPMLRDFSDIMRVEV